jgi:hypothetical protein
MQGWRTGRDGIAAGQQGRGDMAGGMEVPGDDREDGRDDRIQADRRQAGRGLAGARFRSGDQNALQKVALVKKPRVDDVWREPNRSLSHFATHGHQDGRQIAVCLGQANGWTGTAAGKV